MTIRAWPFQSPPLGAPFVLNRCSPQAEGLVGWWPTVPHAGGAVLRDTSGRGRSIGLVAAPTLAPVAVAGRALTYNGTTQYATTAQSVATGTAPFSLVVWARWTTSQNGPVIAGEGKNGDTTPLIILQTQASNRVQYLARSATGTASITSAAGVALNDGLWHCFLCVTEAAASHALYVDGALQGTSATNAGTIGTDTFTIGALFRTIASNFFAGDIADVRVYNRALSAAEALALYAPQTRWQLYGVPVTRGRAAAVAGGDALFNRPFSPVFRGAFG